MRLAELREVRGLHGTATAIYCLHKLRNGAMSQLYVCNINLCGNCMCKSTCKAMSGPGRSWSRGR